MKKKSIVRIFTAVFALSMAVNMTTFAGNGAVKIIRNDGTGTASAENMLKAANTDTLNKNQRSASESGTAVQQTTSGITEATGLEIDKVAVPDSARVLITLSAAKNSDSGTLCVYKKEAGADGALTWKLQLSSAAKLGKAGLYKEKEGDNKTPVGIFRMNTPFGRADRQEGFPDNYIKVNANHYWNGDSDSTLYNKLVSTENYTAFNRAQSEHIINYGSYYNYCIDTGYNADGTPYKGSAIFLHCAVNNENTHGCIAIPEADMIKIMKLYEEGNTYIAIYDTSDKEAMYK